MKNRTPAGPKGCPETYRAAGRRRKQKGGTLILREVRTLAEHGEALRDPDRIRPERCPGCGHPRVHVHERRARVFRGEAGRRPKVELVILIVRCAFKACRAVWRLLPIFVARFLRRRWRTIAELLRGSRPAARRTLERWLARLRSSGAAIVAALGGSGLPSLRVLAAHLGRGATRLEVLDAVGGLDALAGLAALLHELAPQVRLL